MEQQSIFRTALSWLLYCLGDGLSRLIQLWNPLGRLYPIYNRLMLWSAALDKAGKVWDYVGATEEEKKGV